MEQRCTKCKQVAFCFVSELEYSLCMNCSGVNEDLARHGIWNGKDYEKNQDQLELPLEHPA